MLGNYCLIYHINYNIIYLLYKLNRLLLSSESRTPHCRCPNVLFLFIGIYPGMYKLGVSSLPVDISLLKSCSNWLAIGPEDTKSWNKNIINHIILIATNKWHYKYSVPTDMFLLETLLTIKYLPLKCKRNWMHALLCNILVFLPSMDNIHSGIPITFLTSSKNCALRIREKVKYMPST